MYISLESSKDITSFYKKIKYIKHSKKNIYISISKKLKINSFEKNNILSIVNALNIKNKTKRLEFIYDSACKYIDNNYVSKNYCEFVNNQCIVQRNHSKKNFDGCCMHCKYINKNCKIKSLGCKLYFCNYLKKTKKCPSINDIIILKYLFNWKQKIIARTAIYETKEETIKDLKRKSIFLWSLKNVKDNRKV